MGSILGAHLARAGHSVAMLARGARAEHLEAHGIRIRGLSDFSTPVRTLRDPAQLHSAGVLIVATKTPGTAEALATLRHARFGVTLSIQNGPLKDELLRQAFGAERVLGALADTSGELLPEGDVLFTRNVNILVGELAGGESARAQQLARTLDAAGVRAAASPGDPLARVVEVLRLGGPHRPRGDDAGRHLEIPRRCRLGARAGAAGARDGVPGARARPGAQRSRHPADAAPVRGKRSGGGGRGHARPVRTTGSMRPSTACRRCRMSRPAAPWR